MELVQELECLLCMLQFTACRNDEEVREGKKVKKEWERKWNRVRGGGRSSNQPAYLFYGLTIIHQVHA